MQFASVIRGWPLPQLLRGVGIAATLAGVVFWAWTLLRPDPHLPVAVTPVLPEAAVPGKAVARWFDPAAAKLNILVLAVIGGNGPQAAMLAINGAAPRVHVPGARLGPSTTLLAVESDAIIIDRAGVQQRLPLVARAPNSPESLISARQR